MNADLGVHPGRTPGSDLSSQFLDSARRPWLDHRASWIGKHFGALCQMISSYTRLYPRYARISTIDQNADMQLKALQREGVDRKNIFKDELSGATTNRPALLRCLKKLKDGATIIVWKLDRLARSLRDLIAMVEDFNRRGVNFRWLTEEIGATTPGGKLTFHIFAAPAEFERGSVRPGPKRKLSRQQIDHARKLIEEVSAAKTWPGCSKWGASHSTGRLLV